MFRRANGPAAQALSSVPSAQKVREHETPYDPGNGGAIEYRRVRADRDGGICARATDQDQAVRDDAEDRSGDGEGEDQRRRHASGGRSLEPGSGRLGSERVEVPVRLLE